jgi:hypothetical protein
LDAAERVFKRLPPFCIFQRFRTLIVLKVTPTQPLLIEKGMSAHIQDFECFYDMVQVALELCHQKLFSQ